MPPSRKTRAFSSQTPKAETRPNSGSFLSRSLSQLDSKLSKSSDAPQLRRAEAVEPWQRTWRGRNEASRKRPPGKRAGKNRREDTEGALTNERSWCFFSSVSSFSYTLTFSRSLARGSCLIRIISGAIWMDTERAKSQVSGCMQQQLLVARTKRVLDACRTKKREVSPNVTTHDTRQSSHYHVEPRHDMENATGRSRIPSETFLERSKRPALKRGAAIAVSSSRSQCIDNSKIAFRPTVRAWRKTSKTTASG